MGTAQVYSQALQHWGKPLSELFRLLYETDDVDTAMAHTLTHHQEYPKLLLPHTIPTIKHLRAAGKLIGIITATSRTSFEHDVTSLGIPKDCIDYVQTAEDTPFHKPDPRVFEPAIAWLKAQNITPDEVMYVGDGLQDMKAAIGAGFSFLGVETGLITADQFTAAEAKSIPDIGQLMR
jgi:phosphoglycolate phosphatase-like HAD superfamily hydrolase